MDAEMRVKQILLLISCWTLIKVKRAHDTKQQILLTRIRASVRRLTNMSKVMEVMTQESRESPAGLPEHLRGTA